MRRPVRARLSSPILWAFLIGLLVRVALPAGVMVDARADAGPTITLCSAQGPVEVVQEGDHFKPVKHAPAKHHGAGDCPFAGGHAYTPPAAVVVPVADSTRWPPALPPTPRERSPALGLRAPPPPSHAPPFSEA